MTPLLVLTLTATLSTPAPAPAPRVHTPLLTQAVALATPPSVSSPSTRARMAPGGDSLENGAIIGGTLGGLGMGGFVGLLCYAMDETEGSGDCVKAALLWTGIGAAGGAALGAGVDALFSHAPAPRKGGVRSMPMPSGPSARVRVRF